MEQPRKHPIEGYVGPAAESVGAGSQSSEPEWSSSGTPTSALSARPQGKAGCSPEEPQETEEAAAGNKTLA